MPENRRSSCCKRRIGSLRWEKNGKHKRTEREKDERVRIVCHAPFPMYIYICMHLIPLHGGVSVPRHRYVNKATKMADHRRHRFRCFVSRDVRRRFPWARHADSDANPQTLDESAMYTFPRTDGVVINIFHRYVFALSSMNDLCSNSTTPCRSARFIHENWAMLSRKHSQLEIVTIG